ncbi:unnamed protein product [Choristocarpus tenellus]
MARPGGLVGSGIEENRMSITGSMPGNMMQSSMSMVMSAAAASAAVAPPQWYRTGRGVDDLLNEAEGLDWLADSGGVASPAFAAAAAAATTTEPTLQAAVGEGIQNSATSQASGMVVPIVPPSSAQLSSAVAQTVSVESGKAVVPAQVAVVAPQSTDMVQRVHTAAVTTPMVDAQCAAPAQTTIRPIIVTQNTAPTHTTAEQMIASQSAAPTQTTVGQMIMTQTVPSSQPFAATAVVTTVPAPATASQGVPDVQTVASTQPATTPATTALTIVATHVATATPGIVTSTSTGTSAGAVPGCGGGTGSLTEIGGGSGSGVASGLGTSGAGGRTVTPESILEGVLPVENPGAALGLPKAPDTAGDTLAQETVSVGGGGGTGQLSLEIHPSHTIPNVAQISVATSFPNQIAQETVLTFGTTTQTPTNGTSFLNPLPGTTLATPLMSGLGTISVLVAGEGKHKVDSSLATLLLAPRQENAIAIAPRAASPKCLDGLHQFQDKEEEQHVLGGASALAAVRTTELPKADTGGLQHQTCEFGKEPAVDLGVMAGTPVAPTALSVSKTFGEGEVVKAVKVSGAVPVELPKSSASVMSPPASGSQPKVAVTGKNIVLPVANDGLKNIVNVNEEVGHGASHTTGMSPTKKIPEVLDVSGNGEEDVSRISLSTHHDPGEGKSFQRLQLIQGNELGLQREGGTGRVEGSTEDVGDREGQGTESPPPDLLDLGFLGEGIEQEYRGQSSFDAEDNFNDERSPCGDNLVVCNPDEGDPGGANSQSGSLMGEGGGDQVLSGTEDSKKCVVSSSHDPEIVHSTAPEYSKDVGSGGIIGGSSGGNGGSAVDDNDNTNGGNGGGGADGCGEGNGDDDENGLDEDAFVAALLDP